LRPKPLELRCRHWGHLRQQRHPFPYRLTCWCWLGRGTTRCCSPARVPCESPKGTTGSSTSVLSQPHASPLSPALGHRRTPCGAGEACIDWPSSPAPKCRPGLARVCGLPRFDRIAAAVLPMRSCQLPVVHRTSGRTTRSRRVAGTLAGQLPFGNPNQPRADVVEFCFIKLSWRRTKPAGALWTPRYFVCIKTACQNTSYRTRNM